MKATRSMARIHGAQSTACQGRASRVVIVLRCVLGVLLLAGGALTACQGPETTASSSSTVGSSPDLQVVEVYRTPSDTRLWQSWICGRYVVWMESLGPGSTSALGYSQSPAYGTCLKYVDTECGHVATVPGSEVQAPPAPHGPYQVQLPVSWASILPCASDGPLRMVWSLPPAELGPDFAFRSLVDWSGEPQARQLLPESVQLLSPTLSADTLAIPLANTDQLQDGLSEGESLRASGVFMLTANMEEPSLVDPMAPTLSATALTGLSPYFTFGSATWLDEGSAEIRDLRDGSRVAVAVPVDSGLVVGGRWAAWYEPLGSSTTADEYSVLLANLESGTVLEVSPVLTTRGVPPVLAVGSDWLVVLAGADGEEGAKASSVSQRLRAYHLPDLARVDMVEILGPNEAATVQVSESRILLAVWPELSNTPHDEPGWIALRIVALPG
ncbi:MAG: hypothetical protein JXA57_05870 [Armatimonadetes bacterium]|nr:hypothetical protein [Armatimonadota bacterium]